VSITGIILAAGRSARLGRPKQLLPLAGRPLLAHTLAHAAASGLDEVILVLGHDAADIAGAVGDHGQRTIVNPDYAAGQSTSLRAGLAALGPKSDAVLVLLGDQPTVTPEVIDAILIAYRANSTPIVAPLYGGQRGHPLLFDRSLFPELAQVSGDEGARSIVRAHPNEMLLVPISGLEAPQDVDTEADYQRLLADWPAQQP
jgi:molybdenum cofactor cytidylyltransferase